MNILNLNKKMIFQTLSTVGSIMPIEHKLNMQIQDTVPPSRNLTVEDDDDGRNCAYFAVTTDYSRLVLLNVVGDQRWAKHFTSLFSNMLEAKVFMETLRKERYEERSKSRNR